MLDMSELKLLEILRKRYNCDVDLHQINVVDGAEDPNWSEMAQSIYRNRMAKFLISGNSIVFPIYRAEDVIIAIEIVNSSHLMPSEIMQIKDCVELVFNDLYLLKEQKSLMKQRQIYLEAQLGKNSNVLPFRPRELH